MTVHQDYEIKINLNELIEKRIPCCDLLHNKKQYFLTKYIQNFKHN